MKIFSWIRPCFEEVFPYRNRNGSGFNIRPQLKFAKPQLPRSYYMMADYDFFSSHLDLQVFCEQLNRRYIFYSVVNLLGILFQFTHSGLIYSR